MASMELTPEQSAEEGKEMADYRPRWAVSQIYLGDEALTALGITEPLKPGTMVRFMGTAKVVSAELREDQQGESENCMSLQPVELDIAAPSADARKMFPKSKMEA
jgi:hypothetical protein